ncbi:MAG TPA: hypothetical protein PLK90_09305 [Clostridiales bacterium]|nr:hypothetical protein [Clostridiales bacterium]HQP70583.1 hypothetical protein [Clostridiales bacterium]
MKEKNKETVKEIIMSDMSLKYRLLDRSAKEEVNDFINFLFSRQSNKKSLSIAGYKKKILSVSIWKDSDLEIFKENQKLFNSWAIQEW